MFSHGFASLYGNAHSGLCYSALAPWLLKTEQNLSLLHEGYEDKESIWSVVFRYWCFKSHSRSYIDGNSVPCLHQNAIRSKPDEMFLLK